MEDNASTADLFISYASEDRKHVSAIVTALETAGWNVWWDQRIDSGASFDQVIEDAIDTAKCIVVVWSAASVRSEWVRAEATEGLERNSLIQILLADIRPPLLFRQRQALSLVDWKQSGESTQLTNVIHSLERTLNHQNASTLPVSQQRTWIKAKVIDGGNVPERPGFDRLLSMILDYLRDVFIYPIVDDSGHLEVVADEGLDGVIQLQVTADNDRYALSLEVQDAISGPKSFAIDSVSRDELLHATADLIAEAAPSLGEKGALDLEPIHAYLDSMSIDLFVQISQGVNCEQRLDWKGAADIYGDLIAKGPVPAGVISGMALALRYQGRLDESKTTLKRAVTQLENASERVVFRIRGLYHLMVSEDPEKAALEYQQLVKSSPMDSTAINNLALCRFGLLDFAAANELSKRILQLYPSESQHLENASLFAFYAGDIDEAERLLDARVDADESPYMPPISVLITALRESPAEALNKAKGLAPNPWVNLSIADMMIALGEKKSALELVDGFIKTDLDDGNRELAARKLLMKAEISDGKEVGQCVVAALSHSSSLETLATAALVCLNHEDSVISDIIRLLKRERGPKARAYAKMAGAVALFNNEDIGEAFHEMDAALQILDLWLIRYGLGTMYFAAGEDLDGIDEFRICEARHAEGCFALLDDVSTYRYLQRVRAVLF